MITPISSSAYWPLQLPLFPRLLVNRFDHIGHALELFLAGENAIDSLAGLALGVADREQGGVGIADDVGLGVLWCAVVGGGRAAPPLPS